MYSGLVKNQERIEENFIAARVTSILSNTDCVSDFLKNR